MYNVESKKLLAKLLAEENISVEFKKTTTAGFDTKSRILILPILKEGLSEEIISLFIMHEVGHALFTPNDEWLESIKTHKKSIVNILEDIRIERKIQVRYPGSKSNFIKGYIELNQERDFFGIRDENVNTMNFLNRLNLYSKIGPSLLVDFNEKEYSYVLRSFETESFSDVLALAKEIENYLKNISDEEKEEGEIDPEQLKSGDYDGEFEFEECDFSDEDLNDFILDGEYQDPFDASTLEYLQQNFDKLISEDCKEQDYINVNLVNSKDYIVSPSQIIKDIKSYYSSFYEGIGFSTEYSLYSKFISENSKTIQYMINEFNINKNAKQLRKEKQNKIGNLDVKKLHNYKISDKLFKNIQIVDKEKSHGLVLFLDWSGSMRPYLNDTIKQVLNLIIFCKKMSIPFEVYAFSECYLQYTYYAKNRKHMEIEPAELGTNVSKKCCTLLNFFSSSMKEIEFKFMANLLLSVNSLSHLDKSIFTNLPNHLYSLGIPPFLNLERTPLDETIILAMDIVPKFKQLHKVDKVQTIFLTDGESTPNIPIAYGPQKLMTNFNSHHFVWRNKQIIFREPKSKIEYKSKIRCVDLGRHYNTLDVTSTIALFNILKRKLDDNIISYRIIEPVHLTSGRLDYYFDTDRLSEAKLAELKLKLRKQNYISVENDMHTKSFLVKSSSLNIDDGELEFDANATTKKIAKSFSQNISKKMSNRLFLSDFIKFIS